MESVVQLVQVEEDCAENAWRFARRNAGIAEAARAEDQNRGKQKVAWEPVRATIGRVYIRRGYSGSKEVSFYPYLEPAYRPASLSSISYLSPTFSTLASFRWHVIEPAMASSRSRANIDTVLCPFPDYFHNYEIKD